MASSSLNYPLLSIPAYYVFSMIPHIYAGSILSANGYQIDNANPRASLSPSAVNGKVPDAAFQKYQRAQNAHGNNLEQLPLYATAVLASIIAERATGRGLGNAAVFNDVTGLTTFIGAFMAIRWVLVSSTRLMLADIIAVLLMSSLTFKLRSTARALFVAHFGPLVLDFQAIRFTRRRCCLAKCLIPK